MKIMFVCHGNICRSPMAEFIMKELARREGLSDKLAVASSATSTEEIYMGVGNPIYPGAKEELLRRGIPFDERCATRLFFSDYEKYDLFVGMDHANVRTMYRIFGTDPERKIKKLLDYTGSGADVADPWYSDRFDVAFDDIMEGCEALMEKIKNDIS